MPHPLASCLPMRPLLLLLATLPLVAETTPAAPSVPAIPTTPATAAPAVTPAAPAAPSTSALTPEEQRQLRNARAKANKQPEIAAALKAEQEAYRVAKEAKSAKKPKAEVDALYEKARALRAAREKLRDAAILLANPALKPLVDKAAARNASAPAAPSTAPAEKKDGEDEKDS